MTCELGKSLDRPALIEHPRQREHCTKMLKGMGRRRVLEEIQDNVKKKDRSVDKELGFCLADWIAFCR